MNVLITGYVGFIGFHLTNTLLNEKKIKKVLALDNFNDYYDVKLKKTRLKKLKQNKNYHKLIQAKIDIKNFEKIYLFTKKYKISYIFHLAAQAGIRHSFSNPRTYIDSNIIGFFNILEIAKSQKVKKLIYASTSSAYGNNKKTPYSEKSMINEPLQLYAATKISNEVMAYSYSHLYKFQSIGLRFFTVYGPYGRPDMAIYKFVDAIYKNKKIKLFGNGKLIRDFTYIDDIVDGMLKILKSDYKISTKKNSYHEVFNLGRGKPIEISYLLKKLQFLTGKKGLISFEKNNNSEMQKTHCSINKFKNNFNYKPQTNLNDGLKLFIKWYQEYYGIYKD